MNLGTEDQAMSYACRLSKSILHSLNLLRDLPTEERIRRGGLNCSDLRMRVYDGAEHLYTLAERGFYQQLDWLKRNYAYQLCDHSLTTLLSYAVAGGNVELICKLTDSKRVIIQAYMVSGRVADFDSYVMNSRFTIRKVLKIREITLFLCTGNNYVDFLEWYSFRAGNRIRPAELFGNWIISDLTDETHAWFRKHLTKGEQKTAFLSAAMRGNACMLSIMFDYGFAINYDMCIEAAPNDETRKHLRDRRDRKR